METLRYIRSKHTADVIRETSPPPRRTQAPTQREEKAELELYEGGREEIFRERGVREGRRFDELRRRRYRSAGSACRGRKSEKEKKNHTIRTTQLGRPYRKSERAREIPASLPRP